MKSYPKPYIGSLKTEKPDKILSDRIRSLMLLADG